ncbi:YqaA family protein [Ectothiorhodospira variabilis]|uniref:YqaA family protein n=1 Tax=Ectothiorhodospira variabilis TaxID=505694 RepID=UPI001EFBEFA0|nr:YqaA family protein [Ectothiorhodospira variabilis]MCG5493762.1 DedA family protein [Ectothiorhodospira variabilis]MCG5503961.1 DedA family protein [Ectothiorhodospira variabilis]MCG5507116.1 DedA family protein [Ectothiorhodospira variabilis]
MRLFGPLYDRVMMWSRHRHAPRYLAGLSFAESSFFPVPPDVMLAPMAAARPDRAMRLALITTVFSVLGGLLGYLLGYLAFELLQPVIEGAGYGEEMIRAQEWFSVWGVWVVLVAGFSPIPYKLFTVTAGALSMALLPFVVASFLGRGARFFAVALIISWLGPRVEPRLRPYIEWIGWASVILLVLAVIIYQLQG